METVGLALALVAITVEVVLWTVLLALAVRRVARRVRLRLEVLLGWAVAVGWLAPRPPATRSLPSPTG